MLELAKAVTELQTGNVEIFFLVLIRMSFFIFLFPFFNSMNVPAQVKAILSFSLAIVFFPFIAETELVAWNSSGTFFVLVIKEALLGIVLGFGSSFLTSFVNIGGFIMNRDMGLTMSNSTDIITGQQSNNLTNLLIIIFAVIFFATGGHFFFIKIMRQSFDLVPVSHYNYDAGKVFQTFLILTTSAFIQGFKLASPVVGSILVTQIGLGFVARVMPQFNVWILGIPIKLGLGVFILIATLPFMYNVFENSFMDLQYAMVALIKIGM